MLLLFTTYIRALVYGYLRRKYGFYILPYYFPGHLIYHISLYNTSHLPFSVRFDVTVPSGIFLLFPQVLLHDPLNRLGQMCASSPSRGYIPFIAVPTLFV